VESPVEIGLLSLSVFFVFSCLMAFSAVPETSGRGLLGALASMFFIVLAAAVSPDDFEHAARFVAPLCIFGGAIFALNWWHPLERRRAKAEARKSFPLATRQQVKAVAAKMFSGSPVSMFSWLDGRIMLNRGQHSIWCDKDGWWKGAPTRAAHDYQAEQQRLVESIPEAPSRLSQEAMRELCVHLFFNWSIAGHQFDGSQMKVALERRGEMKTKKYTCGQN
jgi:hypothetical protein